MAEKVERSDRGELEITTLNRMYLDEKRVHVTLLGRGYSWLDAGTHESLNDASQFIQDIEEHQGCPEEIAYKKGWITKEQLVVLGESMKNNQYGQHLLNVAEGKIKY